MKCQKQRDSLRKKAVKNTYKKLTNMQKQSSKKAPTYVKMTKKTEIMCLLTISEKK